MINKFLLEIHGDLLDQVPALLDRSDEGGPAVLAGPDLDGLETVLEESFLEQEDSGAEADAAQEVLVDEDVRLERLHRAKDLRFRSSGLGICHLIMRSLYIPCGAEALTMKKLGSIIMENVRQGCTAICPIKTKTKIGLLIYIYK